MGYTSWRDHSVPHVLHFLVDFKSKVIFKVKKMFFFQPGSYGTWTNPREKSFLSWLPDIPKVFIFCVSCFITYFLLCCSIVVGVQECRCSSSGACHCRREVQFLKTRTPSDQQTNLILEVDKTYTCGIFLYAGRTFQTSMRVIWL